MILTRLTKSKLSKSSLLKWIITSIVKRVNLETMRFGLAYYFGKVIQVIQVPSSVHEIWAQYC